MGTSKYWNHRYPCVGRTEEMHGASESAQSHGASVSGINSWQIQCAIHNRRARKVLMYKDILYTESHRNEAILIAVKYTRR